MSLRQVIRDLTSDHPAESPRWWLWLVEGLPDDSALAASMQGGREFDGWGTDRHMTAALWDAIVGVAPRDKNTKPPTFPRPGKKSEGVSLAKLIPRRKAPAARG